MRPVIACLLLFAPLAAGKPLNRPEVALKDEAPVSVKQVEGGVVLIDFGRVAFGNLKLTPAASIMDPLVVHFGEAASNGRVERKPPGTVRYSKVEVKTLNPRGQVIAPAPDARNTKQPDAILTPTEFGVVTPFRWIEVEGWRGPLDAKQFVRQSAFLAKWSDDEASFHCSDPMLEKVWELSRYSIKATTFAGVYVDGDRERIPYEADAYLNQLSHYNTGTDIAMARASFDRLMERPTWPSEWAPHMVFMAYADWMRTGDAAWLKERYAGLKKKLLLERAGPDRLIGSNDNQIKHDDIVDWPTGERDGYVFTKTNTVVNAFHLAALAKMKEIATAVGNASDAREYEERYQKTSQAFQSLLFDANHGLYRDGVGTDHASLHANLFPLAFGLVPVEQRPKIAKWLAGRGMACSVYGAQYLLDGLFENGEEEAALKLITASGDRSWKHMVDSGTTITWEAWDQKYKPNQDWNHAWGAAPANLLPRHVLGVQPLAPGCKRILIHPHAGALTAASGKVPLVQGPVTIDWKHGDTFQIAIRLPANVTAKVELPASEKSTGVSYGGKPVPAHREGAWWILDKDLTGSAVLEVK